MRYLIISIFIILLHSCTNSKRKAIDYSFIHTYYVDGDRNKFIRVELKHSKLTVYEFDLEVGVIQKCLIKRTKEESKCCNHCNVERVFNSNFKDRNLFLDSLINLDLSDFNSIIKSYNNTLESLDSMAFWNKASLFLDSVIFDLSKDKYYWIIHILPTK